MNEYISLGWVLDIDLVDLFFSFFFSGLFSATHMPYGGSQARG